MTEESGQFQNKIANLEIEKYPRTQEKRRQYKKKLLSNMTAIKITSFNKFNPPVVTQAKKSNGLTQNLRNVKFVLHFN